MTIPLNKIKNFLLYGGVTKDEFEQSEYLMIKSSRHLWISISWVLAVLFTILFGYSLIQHFPKEYTIPYIIMGLFFVIVGVLFTFVFKKETRAINILIHISMIFLVAYGIYLSTVEGKNSTAVIIMVIIIMIPEVITDKPYRVILLIFISTLCVVISTLLYKDSSVRTTDLLNAISSGGISLLVGCYMLNVHIRFYTNERNLRKMAYVDSLTGLGNEFSYLEKRETIDKLMREGKHTPYAVCMFDVNSVKHTDDTYGHIYGCSLIVESAHFIRSIFHTSQVYHVGGDEFIVIAEGNDLANLESIIDSYDAKMENFFITKNDIELRVSCARGFSRVDDGDASFQDVLQRADTLMYQHKAYIKKKLDLPER